MPCGGLGLSVFLHKWVQAMDIHGLSYIPSFQTNTCYIAPKLIEEAPMQPLILTVNSIIFLWSSDLPLSDKY